MHILCGMGRQKYFCKKPPISLDILKIQLNVSKVTSRDNRNMIATSEGKHYGDIAGVQNLRQGIAHALSRLEEYCAK